MSGRPPYNLDAIIVEATGEPYRFEFGGDVYEIHGRPDLRVASAFEDRRLGEALRLLLGPDQWARLQASPAKFGPEHLGALLDDYGKFLGAAPGESQASTGSSSSTGGPSKRTSKPRTTSRSST